MFFHHLKQTRGLEVHPVKIAVVAHIRHAVAEPFQGGMEAHAMSLCAGLRASGHAVTLFAAAGSSDPGLHAICAAPYEALLPWARYRGSQALGEYQRDAFATARLAIARGRFDVVHANMLFPQWLEWMIADGQPCVFSQHVPPFGTMRTAVQAVGNRPWVQHTVPSRSQLPLWRPAVPNMHVAHNGVDTDFWQPMSDPGGHFAWTGRIVPNKGLSYAIAAAKLANERLEIFGPIEDSGYFDARIRPSLSAGIRYRGHLSSRELASEVARARAVLVTPTWDEPFGLVAAEALACGVPVLAFDRGAMREVIEQCGIIVPANDSAALAQAMERVGNIARAQCRQRACDHLSIAAMVRGYEALYDAAIAATGVSTDVSLAARAAASASSSSSTSALLA